MSGTWNIIGPCGSNRGSMPSVVWLSPLTSIESRRCTELRASTPPPPPAAPEEPARHSASTSSSSPAGSAPRRPRTASPEAAVARRVSEWRRISSVSNHEGGSRAGATARARARRGCWNSTPSRCRRASRRAVRARICTSRRLTCSTSCSCVRTKPCTAASESKSPIAMPLMRVTASPTRTLRRWSPAFDGRSSTTVTPSTWAGLPANLSRKRPGCA
mmetsp:Transcript_34496/g.111338  ORF Transcript_34496/g.111338 Transcript_34496/m.111338 type:complete len:217 (-) Transcript_34496:126-776(-)